MRPAVPAFIVITTSIWFLGAIGIGGYIFIRSVLTLLGYRHGVTGRRTMGIVVSLSLVGFGVGVIHIGRRMGRTDENEVAAFLARHLEATEPPDKVL